MEWLGEDCVLEGLCRAMAMAAAAMLGHSGRLSPHCCGGGPPLTAGFVLGEGTSVTGACAAGGLAGRRRSPACGDGLLGVLEGGLQGAALPSWGAFFGL